jgi:hypothetical protein
MSADARRTLYLHTGTWKTGSTALQAHLNLNRERLGAAGVSYEFPPNTDRWQGNGTSLAGTLLGRHVASGTLSDLLQAYFADRPIAVCSSENFTSFGNSEWEQLRDAAAHLDLRVRTVTYLRDVAPYYQSMHAQAFKAGEHYCDLATFCRVNSYATVLDSLRALLEHFGREAMTVARYESVSDAIDAPLLAALGLDPALLDGSMLARRINRSLTSYEMKILARLVEKTGQQFANEVANLLLNKRPDLEPDYLLDHSLLEELRGRHQSDVRWINETFFDGADSLTIAATRDAEQSKVSASGDAERAIDADLADWCIDKIASVQDAAVSFIAERMANIDWVNISDPAVPLDFDPIAYLILNVDVLKAGVPPCAHYITSGQHNAARRWRWESR